MSLYEKSHLEAVKAVALLIYDLFIINITFRLPSLGRVDETAPFYVLATMVGIALLGTLMLFGPTASIAPTGDLLAAATLVNPISSSSEEDPMGARRGHVG